MVDARKRGWYTVVRQERCVESSDTCRQLCRKISRIFWAERGDFADEAARSLEAIGIAPEEIGMDEAVAETGNGFDGLEEDWAARRVALAKAFLLAIAAVDPKTAGYIAGDPQYAWIR